MKKLITVGSLTILFCVFMYLAYDMASLPSTYDGAGKVIVNETLSETGAINSVTATVFDFRGFDTLGESIVLFTASTPPCRFFLS